jgi:prolyl-tRNA synthetase
MVMVHGDNKGLVLPPRVAPIQIVVIPVPFRGIDPSEECLKVTRQLQEAGFRVKDDVRDNYKPGWKYSHWELKGVPLRIEIGPRDIEKKQVFLFLLLKLIKLYLIARYYKKTRALISVLLTLNYQRKSCSSCCCESLVLL